MKIRTRLHSSRMRTARALAVSPSMLCAGGVSAPGGCLLGVSAPGGVSAPSGVSAPRGCLLWGVSAGGCLLPGRCLLLGVSAPRGVCSQGCLLPGVSAPGGCLLSRGGVCSWGVSAPRGCVCSGGCLLQGGAPGQVLPPVDRHTPVNILPCPKLHLRAVKTRLYIGECYIIDLNWKS